MDVLYERVAGLDVHKDTVVACVRIMVDGKTARECRTFATTTEQLVALRAWLEECRCTHVAMEATGVYWMPVYAALEAAGCFDLTSSTRITPRRCASARPTSRMPNGWPIWFAMIL